MKNINTITADHKCIQMSSGHILVFRPRIQLVPVQVEKNRKDFTGADEHIVSGFGEKIIKWTIPMHSWVLRGGD